MSKPNKLKLYTRSIGTRLISRSSGWIFLFDFSNIIYLDLFTFSDNLFIFSQSFILVSSLFIAVFKSWSCSLLDSLFRLLDRVVSSAYIIKSNRLLACDKSFMY